MSQKRKKVRSKKCEKLPVRKKYRGKNYVIVHRDLSNRDIRILTPIYRKANRRVHKVKQCDGKYSMYWVP